MIDSFRIVFKRRIFLPNFSIDKFFDREIFTVNQFRIVKWPSFANILRLIYGTLRIADCFLYIKFHKKNLLTIFTFLRFCFAKAGNEI